MLRYNPDTYFKINVKTCAESSTWTRPRVQPIVTNALLFPLQFPVFMSYSASPLPHSHPPNPTSSSKRQDEGSANICCAATVSGCGAGHMSQQWKIIVIGSPSQQLALYGWMAEANVNPFHPTAAKPQLSTNRKLVLPRDQSPVSHESLLYHRHLL